MVEIKRSVLVGYSPAQMYALVDRVEDYPRFLPWCGGATVIHRDAHTTRATILIDYHGIKHGFTTENAKREPEEMKIRLIEGPFRRLDGDWRFIELGESGCRIEFSLHYEFASRLLEKLVGPVFSHIANTLVDAFVRRAEQVYG
ncbi:MAG: type II toxin-antitoxin system RatA family toxin [Betaproteobacteria bacterium]|nr:type II toxin-antitoxin system RatA family toxin [Betaproteobacteria bacterium]